MGWSEDFWAGSGAKGREDSVSKGKEVVMNVVCVHKGGGWSD